MNQSALLSLKLAKSLACKQEIPLACPCPNNDITNWINILNTACENGATGAPGAPGISGATGSVGATGSPGSTGLGFTWKGQFNSSTQYNINDIVTYTDGNIYICTSNNLITCYTNNGYNINGLSFIQFQFPGSSSNQILLLGNLSIPLGSFISGPFVQPGTTIIATIATTDPDSINNASPAVGVTLSLPLISNYSLNWKPGTVYAYSVSLPANILTNFTLMLTGGNGQSPGLSGITGATGAPGVFSGSVTGSIIPDIGNIYDLGSLSRPFRDLYVSSGTIYIGSAQLSSDTSGNIYVKNNIGNLISVLGSSGTTGATGFTGARGATGATGFTGSPGATGFTGAPGGVTSIIAGTNITISPTNGVGTVTINASGGGGGATLPNPLLTGGTGTYLQTPDGTLANLRWGPLGYKTSIIRFKANNQTTYTGDVDTSSMLSSMFTSATIVSGGTITLTLAAPYYYSSSSGITNPKLVNFFGQMIYYATGTSMKSYSIPGKQDSGTGPLVTASPASGNIITITSLTSGLVASPSITDTSSIFYTGSEYYGIVLNITFLN